MLSKKKTIPKSKEKTSSVKKSREASNFSSRDGSTSDTKIKIVGVGGGGCSIVSELSTNIRRVDFIAANTDQRSLKELKNKIKIFQFGEKVTGGFGTGMNYELGREAAMGDKEKIKKMLEGQDMCIFVSCLGGGTGEGAMPVFAKIAKDLGMITYGIFTLPFSFEGTRKMETALESLKIVREHLNVITVLPNENIFKIVDKKTPLKEALSIINKNLSESLQGLIETVYGTGVINIDFADLRTMLEGRGKIAYLNTTEFDATKGVESAIKQTISSPFCSYGINGTGSVLFNITGSGNLGLRDVSLISEGISGLTGKNSKVIFGISQDRKVGNKVKITLLAVGCESEEILPKDKKKAIKKTPKVLPKEKLIKKVRAKKKAKKSPKEEKKKIEPLNEKRIDIKIRRNALEVKKVAEEAEKEIIENEDKWDTPAFIRRNSSNE